jgi:predicted SAM-dependent methyltransferase
MTESLRTLCKRSLTLVSAARGFRFGVEYFRNQKLSVKRRRERQAAIQSYLRNHQVRKLQIGTQGHILPGWLNSDLQPVDPGIIFMDAREPFPFADRTFDYIFCEHCIEHIGYSEGLCALRECHRVLKPGGRVRIATPNLSVIVGLCSSPRNEMQERYIKWYVDTYTPEFDSYAPCFVVNNSFRLWGHQFIYDAETLASALTTAGFTELRWFAPGESDDENLRGIEGHGKRAGDDMNCFETMIAEAARI